MTTVANVSKGQTEKSYKGELQTLCQWQTDMSYKGGLQTLCQGQTDMSYKGELQTLTKPSMRHRVCPSETVLQTYQITVHYNYTHVQGQK